MDTVFSVQAVMGLVDSITAPLRAIRGGMADTERAAGGLSATMGRVSKSLLPFAAAAGVFLAALSPGIGTAADFQKEISGVGAVSRASVQDMAVLEQAALDLGASTAWSAMQVAGAQKKLSMAGYDVQQSVAALPGVLNLASAAGEDLAGSADIASNILSAFKLEASQTADVADILTATFTSSNTQLSGLGSTMATVGPVAQAAGAQLAEVAAMAGVLGNVGIPAAVAGTALKISFQRLQAPTGAAAEELSNLGIATKDAAGDMLPIFDILESLETQTAAMGSADRAAVLKNIFGEEAIGGITALMGQGIGSIREYADTLGNSTGTAAEVARRQLDNMRGALTMLSSAWEGLKISMGSIFLPVLTPIIQGITRVVSWLNFLAKTPVGKAILALAAAVSVAVVAVTAFSGAVALAGIALPFIATALAGVAAAVAAVSWPVWLIIAAVGALYLAFKNNFGGIADTVSGWWDTIRLVFQGVRAVFATLTGTVGEIEGELAKEIKAAGLVGLVTTVARVVFRIREYFAGLWGAIAFSAAGVVDILAPVFQSFVGVLAPLWAALTSVASAVYQVIRALTGAGAATDAGGWRTFGEVVGIVVGGAFQVLAWAVRIALAPVQLLFEIVGFLLRQFVTLGRGIGTVAGWIVTRLTGMWTAVSGIINGFVGTLASLVSAAGTAGSGVSAAFNAMLGAVKWVFMNLTPVGWLIQAVAGISDFIAGIDLSQAGAKLMQTFTSGIKSAITAPVEMVKSGLSKIRNLLPFSDAKEGPLSAITASGRALMDTIGDGVRGAAPDLTKTARNAMAGVAAALVIASPAAANLPDMPEPPVVSAPVVEAAAMPEMPAPDMPDIQAPGVSGPELPDIQAPEIGPVTAPDIPDLPAMSVPAAEMPALAEVQAPAISQPVVPDIDPPGVFDVRVPEVGLPEVPDIQPPGITSPDMPDIQAPGVSGPELPDIQAPEIGPVTAPDIPDLPAMSVPAAEMPALAEVQAPAISQPVVPDIDPPGVSDVRVPEVGLPEVPDIQPPGVASPEIPAVQLPVIAGPEISDIQAPGFQMPDVPDIQAPGIASPDVPDIYPPEIGPVTAPDMPDLPAMSVPAAEMPALAEVQAPAMSMPVVPDIDPPGVSDIQMPEVGLPEVPDIQPPGIASPEIPDIQAPGLQLPEVPDIQAPKGPSEIPGPLAGMDIGSDTKEKGGAGKNRAPEKQGRPVTIQNLTVNLPGVANAQSFVEQLQQMVGGYDG
jgi:TP901 family phage tail tape measure protein